MSTKNEAFDKIRDILSEYSADMNFAMASEYARRCDYSQAKALLLPHGKIPDSTRELDLLARISANNGDSVAAKRFWLLALEKEPDNQNIKESIAEIANMEPEEKSLEDQFLFNLCTRLLLIVILVILIIKIV